MYACSCVCGCTTFSKFIERMSHKFANNTAEMRASHWLLLGAACVMCYSVAADDAKVGLRDEVCMHVCVSQYLCVSVCCLSVVYHHSVAEASLCACLYPSTSLCLSLCCVTHAHTHTHTHTHAHTLSLSLSHTNKHTHPHNHIHTHTQTRTSTHTHIKSPT